MKPVLGGFETQLKFIKFPTGEHFNLPGHELYHSKVRILLVEVYLKYKNLNIYIKDFMKKLREMNRFLSAVNGYSVFCFKRVLFMSNF